MHGKIHEIATSHVSSRILQSCVKLCAQEERDAVFEELRPHLLNLSTNVYAVHLVKKLLDSASKSQLDWFISSLHGHVSSLLRHMVGSVVVEHIFQLGNGSQKRQLLSELYSPELQLFKDLTFGTEGRLVDIISKMGLNKSSVLQHMTSVIQPILEKGIADHSVIHVDSDEVHEEKLHVDGSTKKDPTVRRHELLVDSGLAESLIDTCIENVEELLFSHFGKDVIYEVAVGGADAILSHPLSEKLESLHEVIASLAAKPKEDESKDKHAMENFHANRTIRKLILDSPAFATTFWRSALKGRCKMWSQGHSMKVVSAYLESSDTGTRNLAKEELQPLADGGVLQVFDGTQKTARKSN